MQLTELSTDVKSFIKESPSIRPEYLILSDLKWRYLVRSVIRGVNIMLLGPAGCGKTTAVATVAKAMDRPFFYINLGATQDPRSSLIGNTHFDKDKGTYFADAAFVRAIQTPNAVILLDELSRAHPEAWNILMTVLDESQRYLRLDESPNGEIVKVAEGVCFAATANIGVEYTSTRIIDLAIKDRFLMLKMDVLSREQQTGLIRQVCPTISDRDADALTAIYEQINHEVNTNSGRLSSGLSTRTTLAAAKVICDGFTLQESLEACVYPYFSEDGGTESELTYVRQIALKYLPQDNLSNDNMFDENDTADSNS
jgi:nitric oxide reductase NorQ protein